MTERDHPKLLMQILREYDVMLMSSLKARSHVFDKEVSLSVFKGSRVKSTIHDNRDDFKITLLLPFLVKLEQIDIIFFDRSHDRLHVTNDC